MKETFRASTTFWSRIAAVGLDVPFRLKAIQRGIDCADRYFTLRAEFNLLPHGNSIKLDPSAAEAPAQ
jgi:hypothetical protein